MKDNLLPYDGLVQYYGQIMPAEQAMHYYSRLLSAIAWKHDEARIFGKHFITKRKVAWYAEASIPYSYSNTTKKALPWTTELLQLKELTERLTGHSFNSCLLNLYHDGSEGMAWHSDDEKALAKGAPIASLSFGAERKFSFKHKTNGALVSLLLENGSLLLMQSPTQTNWWHRLPKSAKITTPRINLTFRSMNIGDPASLSQNNRKRL